jgi:hypothetical protein
MRPEISLLHMPFALLLGAAGLAAVMTVAEIRPANPGGAIRKLLRGLCAIPAAMIMLLVSYLVWISMGPYFLALLLLLIFVLIAALAIPSIARHLDALGSDRLLFVWLLVALYSFAGALGYLILVARLGGNIRLI